MGERKLQGWLRRARPRGPRCLILPWLLMVDICCFWLPRIHFSSFEQQSLDFLFEDHPFLSAQILEGVCSSFLLSAGQEEGTGPKPGQLVPFLGLGVPSRVRQGGTDVGADTSHRGISEKLASVPAPRPLVCSGSCPFLGLIVAFLWLLGADNLSITPASV